MDEKIKIKNDKGEEKEYNLLFSFDSKNTNKTYITYTAFEKDEDGNIKCYSSEIDDGKLNPVTTQEELDTIDELLKSLQEGIKFKYQKTEE